MASTKTHEIFFGSVEWRVINQIKLSVSLPFNRPKATDRQYWESLYSNPRPALWTNLSQCRLSVHLFRQLEFRFVARQKREQRAVEKSISPAELLQNWMALRGLQDFSNITRAVQYANDGDLLCRGLKKDHIVAMRASAQVIRQLGPPPIARRVETNLFAMRTQLGHETSGASRIVLRNIVADLLKIERCQGRYQQLH